MAASAVKVAVRVRPFNNREREEGAELCVDMKGNMTKVWNREQGTSREFFFDYSYWSHDGSREDPETGILSKDSPGSRYADQQMVFNDIGIGVLDNAWEGYHCCLFAYGQTGSGKSYSMVGYGNNKGIIPIACEEIFRRINDRASPYIECKVAASMLEIYNEQVQDLLQPPQNRVKGGLKIREDPKRGVFVEDQTEEVVASYEEISAVLDKGNKSRTVAATQMNATSSRAHTVLTISFTQIFYDEETGKPLNRKQSNINLVDLAGSERASKTGATGDRLQEGSNINKSLSTLGKVITSLAKRSSGQLGKGEVIPYRESKLTRILQNALGGNSMTTMIAAISPATFNYDETMSTLRYADAVKSIKNAAVINETPQEKLIRELKEENERLKAMVEGKYVQSSPGAEVIRMDEETKKEYEKQIEELRKAKEEAEKTWQDRLRDHGSKPHIVPALQQEPEKITKPHLSNLNEDPLLSGYIKHQFKPGRNVIGKKNPSSPPGIIIEGLGVGIDHCVVINQNDEFKIIPSQDANLKTMLNGKILTDETILNHQDRIRFGNHNYFLFIDPDELGGNPFDWEKAVNEANEEQVKVLLGHQDEEAKAKEEEMRKKLEAEWEEARKKMDEERSQLEKLIKSKKNEDSATQKALADKEAELKARQRAMEEEIREKEIKMKQHEEERNALERLKKLLTNAIQQINEANERAVVLGKNALFQPELYREAEIGRTGVGTGLTSTKVRIRVTYPGLSDDFQIKWPLEKLEARLVDMQEICNQLSLGVEPAEIDVGYDPFSDKLDSLGDTYRLVGYAYVYLVVIYNLLNLDEDFIPIIDDRGSRKGSLKVAVEPGLEGASTSDFDNLKELAGKQLNLTISIHDAVDIPDAFSTGVFCKYKLDMVSEEEFSTEKCMETTTNPTFNYLKTHNIDLTTEIAEKFLNHALAIAVYGDITQEMKQRELNKLKANVNKAIVKTGINLNPGMANLDIEEELGAELFDPKSPQGFSKMASVQGKSPRYQDELSRKDEEIRLLKAELAKRSGGEVIIMNQADNTPIVKVQTVKRGSCACLIF